MAEITEKQLIDLVEDLTKFYDDYQKQCDNEDTYYNLTFPVPEVPGFTAHRPATARVAVDAAAAQVDPADIVITVHPRTSKIKHKEEAAIHEQFYKGCWEGILRNNPTLFTRLLKNMYLYGVAIEKVMYDASAFENSPKQNSGESDEDYDDRLAAWRAQSSNDFPFLIFVKHPRNIMVDPSYFTMGRFIYVVERYKRRVGEVRDMYPNWAGGLGRNLNDEVEWVEYWDSEGYMKLCDKETVKPYTKHGYGFIPYKVIDAGLGYEDADGKPQARWRGILNASHYDLELEARMLYFVESILRIQAFAPQDFEIFDPIVTQAEAQTFMDGYEYHPATKQVIPYGMRRAAPVQLNIPAPIFDIIGFVKQSIDDATVSAGARGQRPVGAASGYMAAIIVGMARIKFGPALNSLQRSVEEDNKCFAMFVERFVPAGIAVWGKIDRKPFDIIIRPKDIDGYYVNEVQLTSIAPEEESRRTADGIRIYQSGLASKEWIQTNYLKMRDTLRDLRQQIVEKALNDPTVSQVLIQSVVQSPEFQQQLAVVGAAAGVPGNSLGMRGVPPPQGGGGQVIPEVKPPMEAGSAAEMELVGRQRTGQVELKAANPSMMEGMA